MLFSIYLQYKRPSHRIMAGSVGFDTKLNIQKLMGHIKYSSKKVSMFFIMRITSGILPIDSFD